MRVAMHQPHYLPWLGLVDKIDNSDLFIVLDNVQYERKGWQNRNYVASKNGPVLLTVPVIQQSRDERVMDKVIDTDQNWCEKHRRTIAQHGYQGTPFWDDFGDEILRIYDREWDRLYDIAMATTYFVLHYFNVTTPIVRASELGEFPGQKSELLAQLSAKVGATTMLSGDGARGYVDEEIFQRYGIGVEWQNFQHPEYSQHTVKKGEFLPRMSSIDLLLNVGPAGIDLLRETRSRGPSAG